MIDQLYQLLYCPLEGLQIVQFVGVVHTYSPGGEFGRNFLHSRLPAGGL